MIPKRITWRDTAGKIVGGLLFPRPGEFRFVAPSVRFEFKPAEKRFDVVQDFTDTELNNIVG